MVVSPYGSLDTCQFSHVHLYKSPKDVVLLAIILKSQFPLQHSLNMLPKSLLAIVVFAVSPIAEVAAESGWRQTCQDPIFGWSERNNDYILTATCAGGDRGWNVNTSIILGNCFANAGGRLQAQAK